MEDLTGKQFGPYQIVAPLGEGGMASVYKAYQPDMLRSRFYLATSRKILNLLPAFNGKPKFWHNSSIRTSCRCLIPAKQRVIPI